MKKFIVAVLIIVSLVLVSCGTTQNESPAPAAPPPDNVSSESEPAENSVPDYSGVNIRIAQQYGMHYVPVYVMQQMGILEKHVPGAKLEWSQLAGGSAINEALIAGQLDVAFMGIPPLLNAWSKGVDYKIACGISVLPMDLMVMDPAIKTLSDLTAASKIALPGVASIQHIMLSMGAEKYLGDARALDDNLLAMPHPDAFAALISGTDITAHFTSIPYVDLEMREGAHSILSDLDVFESGSSIVCVTTEKFYNNQSDIYDRLMAALSEAIDLISAKDSEVVKIVAEVEKISEEDALRYLDWPDTFYDTKVYGAMGLAAFMYEQGYIDKAPGNASEIMWGNAVAVDK